jgi:peptide/nickel transport system permease protein
MLAFVIRRLWQAALVMLVVAFVAFSLFQYVGDPVLAMVGQDATPEQRDELRRDLGLDRPFYVQFGRFVSNAAQGEFGLSFRQGRKVSTLLRERLPATLELSLCAAALALAVGVPMGVYTALRRGGFFANLLLAVSLIGVSLPTFLIGILLVLAFAVWLGWLPSYGRWDGGRAGSSPPMGSSIWCCPRSRCACSSSPSSCGWSGPRCSKCCAPTTSASRAPAACPTGPCTSATH